MMLKDFKNKRILVDFKINITLCYIEKDLEFDNFVTSDTVLMLKQRTAKKLKIQEKEL